MDGRCQSGRIIGGHKHPANRRRAVRRLQPFPRHLGPEARNGGCLGHADHAVIITAHAGIGLIGRAAVTPALENVTLWHERDISHSSVERAIAPDATVTLDFALARLSGMMKQLTIYPERMAENIESLGGVVHSGEILLALAKSGISREDAYKIVQRNAMATWTRLGQPDALTFRQNLAADPDVSGRVAAVDIDAAMDSRLHLRRLDAIYTRVFGESGPAQ